MAAISESARLCRSLSRLLISLQNKNGIPCRRNLTCSSCMFIKKGAADRKKGKDARDPLPVFLNKDVQVILRKITGFDVEKIHAPKPTQKARKPEYKLLTDTELLEEQQKALVESMSLLEMPPVMASRDSATRILSRDPKISPMLDSKYILIDIGPSSDSRNRLISVRDTDGTLRTATGKETDRMNQIYNPVPGRLLYPPRMFQDKYLQKMMNQEKYIYVLDRACTQFEPDNEDFIRVTKKVYQHILEKGKFDLLRSTRYFGPMSFYLCWEKKIGGLLVDMIQRDLLSDAVDLIRLHHIIHNKRVGVTPPEQDQLTVVKEFCQSNLKDPEKSKLELAIQVCENAAQSEQKVHHSSG